MKPGFSHMRKEANEQQEEREYLKSVRRNIVYGSAPWWMLKEIPYHRIYPAKQVSIGDHYKTFLLQVFSKRFFNLKWKFYELEQIKEKLLGEGYVPF